MQLLIEFLPSWNLDDVLLFCTRPSKHVNAMSALTQVFAQSDEFAQLAKSASCLISLYLIFFIWGYFG